MRNLKFTYFAIMPYLVKYKKFKLRVAAVGSKELVKDR